jgi:hypothetical protein
MEECETKICHNFTFAVIYIEVNFEKNIINFSWISNPIRIVCREILLVFSPESCSSRLLLSDTHIIEEV